MFVYIRTLNLSQRVRVSMYAYELQVYRRARVSGGFLIARTSLSINYGHYLVNGRLLGKTRLTRCLRWDIAAATPAVSPSLLRSVISRLYFRLYFRWILFFFRFVFISIYNCCERHVLFFEMFIYLCIYGRALVSRCSISKSNFGD